MTTRVRGLKSVLVLLAGELTLLSGLAALSILTGCHAASSTNSPLQFAYVGPATATLREDLAAHSSQVTNVKHGDRVEIVDTRRRLVRVRTAEGGEGWIDANLLLTSQQMDELNRITELAAKLPVQGKATVGDALNVHTGPSRQSPTLFQIPENGTLEVLAHRSSSRTGQVPDVVAAIQTRPAKPKKAKGKEKPESAEAKQVPPVPLPPPPAPPLNWERMSVPHGVDSGKKGAAENTPPPLPPDDWSLIRTPQNQVGWALSRNLSMSVPDDVIRNTDGHRITAFLDLGEVPEVPNAGRGKHNWVWITTAMRGAPFDFDSFRVLVWNPVKHRYETARMERNLAGFYPLQMVKEEAAAPKDAPPPSPGAAADIQTEAAPQTARATPMVKDEKRFSLVIAEGGGNHIYRRVYALTGRRVRLVSTTAIPQLAQPTTYTRSAYDPLAAPPVQKDWWDSKVDWVKGWWKK